MSRALAQLGRWNPIAVYLATILAVAVQLTARAIAHLWLGERLAPGTLNLAVLALSLLPSICLFQLIHLTLEGRRLALVAIELAALVLYALLSIERLSLRTAPDFAMLATAPMAFVHRELGWLAHSPGCRIALVLLACGVLALVALELLWRTLSKRQAPAPRLRRGLAAGGVYVALLFCPLPSHDEVVSWLRSMVRYFGESSRPRLAAAGLPVNKPYPYLQRSAAPPAGPRPRPHVFVIALESFNAGFVESQLGDGRPITPVFDRQIREGLYAEHFYATSVQTARCHFSILCSLPTGLWRKLQVSYPELRLNCLPRLLASQGYRTIFYSGHDDLTYDNTEAAMHRLGFAQVRTVEHGPRHEHWGWGWQDDRVYRELFETLERESSSAPVFAFVATIAHHWSFDQAPARERRLFAKPGARREHFLNSLNMSDRYLGELFSQLRQRPLFRDSIVILVGDHGFPADGGVDSPPNESGVADELFRVPLLILWPGRIAPSRRSEATYSQLDIAPTIIELLGLTVDHHFTGRSLLATPDPERAVPIIQPFDGLFLGAVRWPYKYVRRQSTGQELLFDLAHDAGEHDNLVTNRALDIQLASLRRQLPAILFNQQLLDTNRVWPEP